MEDQDGHELELAMPFVVVESVGGPYDDQAFVAGWQMSQISEALSHSGARWSGVVFTDCLPQLDLIAMKHELLVTVHNKDEHWAVVDVDRSRVVE